MSFTGKDGRIRKVFTCLQTNPESKQTPDLFCDFLNVEQEVDDVAVLHDVVLALAADQALCLGGSHGAAGLHILKGNDLGADETPLEIGVDLAGGLGALVPLLMVQARHSSEPAVRKEMRPSRV